MIYVSNNDIIVMFDNLCYRVSLSVLISTHVPGIVLYGRVDIVVGP